MKQEKEKYIFHWSRRKKPLKKEVEEAISKKKIKAIPKKKIKEAEKIKKAVPLDPEIKSGLDC